MAIYHFSAQIISRSQGRSAVASAAYRSAEKLVEERTGQTYDFTKKSDVVQTQILLPEGAPEWMSDREKLWNAVESVERRKDAQLAREINIALPKELSEVQNWDLIMGFVKQEFVDRGMVADVAFHQGHPGGEEQPHAHVMLTMREVTPEGFGPKVRAWNDKGLLTTWREHWAEHCNLALAREGLDLKIDHRTLEAQGIDLEPQSKIGPKAAESSMARLAEHQDLAFRNGERLLKDPDIALKAITQQQSTFTHQDLARFVNRHTRDAEQFDRVKAAIESSPSLVHLGKDDRQRDRFTTQTMLALESQMIARSERMRGTREHTVTREHIENARSSRHLSKEQSTVLSHITEGPDIACVIGLAGTGKSYLLGAAREAWESQGYRVQGMTLSGIAAENLMGSSGIESHTVASRLWHWERDRDLPGKRDVLVVDEAAMLGSRQMAGILSQAEAGGAKVVLVGDHEQLQAIEAGAAYRAVLRHVGFAKMTEIRRQQVDWQKQATRDFATAKTAEALNAYHSHDNVHRFDKKSMAMRAMIEQWDEVRSQSTDASQIMLAYTRDEVQSINEQVRALRHGQQELGQDHVIETSRGTRTFAEQDRIYFLRNENRHLQVKNGTLGTIDRIKGDTLVIRLDRQGEQPGRQVSLNLKDYNDLDHGYAATVYKAQGVTVDRAHVLASPYFDRHSTYVAMSRHREGVDVYLSRDEFSSYAQLNRQLGRQRTKDFSLDYAQQRQFEVPEAQLIKDRTTEPDHSYNVVLTPERERQAAARIAERARVLTLAQLSQQLGFSSLTLDIDLHQCGHFRGNVALEGRQFGVLDLGKGRGNLIPIERVGDPKLDQYLQIQKNVNEYGRVCITAVPVLEPSLDQASKQREMEHDRTLSRSKHQDQEYGER